MQSFTIREPDDLAKMERISPQVPQTRSEEAQKTVRGPFSRRLDARYEPKVREAILLGQRLAARDFNRQGAEFQ
ncbi:MAG: hypothetical protein Q7J57_18000 [Gemmobacter sp.]|nr:hypothetical protein [Gemmobacter sp.]